MATSMNAVAVGLFNKLTGNSALTTLLANGTASVFEMIAPEGEDPPYVVFQAQAPSTPEHTFAGVAMERALYTIKAVTESHSAAGAGTIADKIDDAIVDQALTVTGYTHLETRRYQNVDYVEVVDGKRFNHRGATYRVRVRL